MAWPAALRSSDVQDKIANARVLCVGAGGIGCELLKTLVCTGFKNIELIDLDTIETSNLNRQFLFRKHHVGQSKAETAASVIRTFKPEAAIKAHHANVKESRFDVDFFKGFDVILNGLDNAEARRHVNRLCMAAERPLVESGTAGYIGQATVHIKGATECYECTPKPVQKSFPICTLRNTPDRPIHCIVWSKDMLFARLFGKADEVTDLDEQVQQKEGEAAAEGGEQQPQQQEGADGVAAEAAPEKEDPSFFIRKDEESALDYAVRVFERVYTTDIQRLVAMEDLWQKRAPPVPLELSELLSQEEVQQLGAAAGSGSSKSACRALGMTNPNQKWSVADNARVFIKSIVMYHEQRQSELGSAQFDKDDDLAVDFVTAASNLRSACYGIPIQSAFDAKGMAGNIIHAIATTNAIISGLIVIEAIKILAGLQPALHCTFLNEQPSGKRLLMPQQPEKPRPGCLACGKAQITLRTNTQAMSLATLVSVVLKKRLAVNVPMIMCGDFMYEEGEGLEEDEVEQYQSMLPRPLASLPGGGIKHGSIVHVQDESQHFSVDVIVAHQEEFDEEKDPDGFVIEGTAAPQAQPAEPAPAPGAEPAAAPPQKVAVKEDADGVVMLDDDEEPAQQAAAAAASGKRKREDEEEAAAAAAGGQQQALEEGTAKKARTDGAGAGAAADEDDDVVILD